MAYLLATLVRLAIGKSPELICSTDIWDAGVTELHRRTFGRRESGAFLLGKKGRTRRIEKFVFYDDIDPGALDSGIVIIDGRRLGALWAHCRDTGYEVVADVHVHPRGYRQSKSDKANPIIAEKGHVALILPDFAKGSNQPGKIGVFRYLGDRKWSDQSATLFSPLHLGWWPWR